MSFRVACARCGCAALVTCTVLATAGCGGVGWNGDEVVAYRFRVPGRIQFHNAEHGIERGKVLAWEQSLVGRVRGVPLELEVRMESDSILFRTLMLRGSAVLAALATLGLTV